MTFSSVCSGIEAPSVAWLDWEPLWFAEIEPFCSALLSFRYSKVVNYGDFTKIQEAQRPDVLMGGTPCQSFSVAGKRAGLDDPRGNLALEYLRLAKRIGVRWLVWENVEGVLSSDGGRTFEAFLGAMAQCGYGFAYRVLDAQYDGLAQRRKRVFVVGYLGDWRPPAAVLFERESLRRDTTPSREAREEIAGVLRSGSPGGSSHGKLNGSDQMPMVGMALNAGGARRLDGESETFIPVVHGFAENQRAEVRLMDVAPALNNGGGKPGSGYPAVYVNCDSRTKIDSIARPLKSDTGSGGRGCVLASLPQGYRIQGVDGPHETLQSNPAGGQKGSPVAQGAAVRRLTPLEWERLQGFPDGYTAIDYRGKPAKDGPRYKAIGNSISIPTLRWIGQRIDKVDAILRSLVVE